MFIEDRGSLKDSDVHYWNKGFWCSLKDSEVSDVYWRILRCIKGFWGKLEDSDFWGLLRILWFIEDIWGSLKYSEVH